jgi:circadian clock protein KaiC
MVDTWILVEDIATEGERNRGIYVMKSRGMNHSKEMREFIISSTGITLLPVTRGKKGVLIGSKRIGAEIEMIQPNSKRKQQAEVSVDSKPNL